MNTLAQHPTCFYHPLKVLFLDDNRNFLDTLELKLGDSIDMLTYTDYRAARQAIETNKEDINQIVLKALNQDEVDTTTDHLIDVEVNNIHQLIYDPSRFNCIAVAVIDYKMPEINGIEFCRLIENKQIMKIMLTARADEDIAINAFNENIINKFLVKHTESLDNALLKTIKELQYRYFANLSQTIIDNLGVSLQSLLSDAAYIDLFNHVKEQANAIEYYLIDKSGSFLFLDRYGQPTWLIIRSKIELEKQMQLAAGLDAPNSIVSPLKKKEKLLFLLSEQEYCRPVEEWKDFLFQAQLLNEDYYFSIIQEKTKNAVAWDKIKLHHPS